MPSIPVAKDPVVLSYAALRRAVGIVAVSLPFAVSVPIWLLHHHEYQSSISNYYYTGTRNLFVGSLCAISMFMLCCRGYGRKDERASLFSAVCALGVAFFPTSPDCDQIPCGPSSHAFAISCLHYGSAALLFATLAYFCLRLFTLTADNRKVTARKVQRNRVYKICGWVILASMAALLMRKVILYLYPPQGTGCIKSFPTVMCFEASALIAFGIAWLVKGEAFLKDDPQDLVPTHTLTTDNLLGSLPD